MRIESFESEAFLQELEEAWNNLKPLYDQLHGYVRHKLHKFYQNFRLAVAVMLAASCV